LLLCISLQGCAENPFLSRSGLAEGLARDAGWRPTDIETDHYRLRLYAPAKPLRHRQVVIYIEGDGLAWIDRMLSD